MIKHSIIVSPKPKIRYDSYHGTGSFFNRPVKFSSQKELDEHISNIPFHVGSWITYKTISRPILSQIHYIIARESNYDNLKFDNKGDPKMFALVNNNGRIPGVIPWRRWDSHTDYRLLSKQEWEELVEPSYDFLQNHIKQERELFLKDPGRWSAA